MTLTPGRVNQGLPAAAANAWPVSIPAPPTITEKQDQPAGTSATWTSATSVNTALTNTTVAGYGTATVTITVPATVTAGVITLETSQDGTNWDQAGSVRSGNGLAENVVNLGMSAALTRMYSFSVDAMTQCRARLSTVITGSGNVTVTMAIVAGGIEPLVSHLPPRIPFFYMWSDVTGTAAVESALTNFNFGTKGQANVTAATSIAVAAGKTHRITTAVFYIKQTSTVVNAGFLNLRAAPTVANTSPIIYRCNVGTTAATAVASMYNAVSVSFPDGGLEITGPTQWTMTWATSAATCQVGASFSGYEF